MYRLLAVALFSVSFLADHGFAVNVPFKACSSSSHLALQTVTADVWPPAKGATLSLNVTGNLDEPVSSGKYQVTVKLDGIKLPIDISGSISDFKPLPWANGTLSFTYSQDIPASTPGGSYLVQINAQDQAGADLICLQIAFKESLPAISVKGEAIHPVPSHLLATHAIRSHSKRLGRTWNGGKTDKNVAKRHVRNHHRHSNTE